MNLVGPVFHLFSLGNPDFIIYMAELRADEFGMNFQPWCSKHSRYEFYIPYISTFYAKLVWWNNIPWVAEIYDMIFCFDNNTNFKQFGLGQQYYKFNYWLHYKVYWLHYKRITDFITKMSLTLLQIQLLTSLQKCYWFHYENLTDFIINLSTDFITKVLLTWT